MRIPSSVPLPFQGVNPLEIMSSLVHLCLRGGRRHPQFLNCASLRVSSVRHHPRHPWTTVLLPSATAGHPGIQIWRWSSANLETTSTSSPRGSGWQRESSSNSASWKSTFYLYVFSGLTVGAALLALATRSNSQRARNQMLLPLEISLPCASCAGEESSHRPSKRYNFLAEAVETAAPSVVCIERKETVSTLFGETVSVSSGSGFIVEESGYVLTNAHVVASARRVSVKLQSGQVVDGNVTDIDEVADLALVRLNLPSGEKVPALKFGSSAELRPGEWVIALGSPLSLSNTITAGIVSSVLRPSKELGLQHYRPDMEYVQTDAPITIGNSGGPLVNLDGEVIGVNTMTAGPGISFAIPSDSAKNFVVNANRTVKEKTKREKFAIGISMLSLSPRLIASTQLRSTFPKEVNHGVFLANVWPNGAAAKAGLQRGDVIIRINGKDIQSSNQVYELVQSGKALTMEIVRGGHWKTVTVHPAPLYST